MRTMRTARGVLAILLVAGLVACQRAEMRPAVLPDHAASGQPAVSFEARLRLVDDEPRTFVWTTSYTARSQTWTIVTFSTGLDSYGRWRLDARRYMGSPAGESQASIDGDECPQLAGVLGDLKKMTAGIAAGSTLDLGTGRRGAAQNVAYQVKWRAQPEAGDLWEVRIKSAGGLLGNWSRKSLKNLESCWAQVVPACDGRTADQIRMAQNPPSCASPALEPAGR